MFVCVGVEEVLWLVIAGSWAREGMLELMQGHRDRRGQEGSGIGWNEDTRGLR